MQLQTQGNWKYCEDMLPSVSRTFALNIRELKGDTHRAVLLGYLFFRIADTFEDNLYQSEDEKIKALYDYSDIFKEGKGLDERLRLYEPLKFKWHENSPDKELVENGDQVIRCYFDLPEAYRRIIDPHIVMTSQGMAGFQKRKLEAGSEIFQLQDISDLKNYCYYVAGVVGMMLTQVFCQQENMAGLEPELERYQIDFGLALQLTNVLKDSRKDLGRGWCYLPASLTQKYNVSPEELAGLAPEQERELLWELLDVILPSYDSTLKYIETIPESERSIRMFCLIAFVLSYNTLLYLMKLKGNKIPREKVSSILARCELFASSNRLLREDYQKFLNDLRQVERLKREEGD